MIFDKHSSLTNRAHRSAWAFSKAVNCTRSVRRSAIVPSHSHFPPFVRAEVHGGGLAQRLGGRPCLFPRCHRLAETPTYRVDQRGAARSSRRDVRWTLTLPYGRPRAINRTHCAKCKGAETAATHHRVRQIVSKLLSKICPHTAPAKRHSPRRRTMASLRISGVRWSTPFVGECDHNDQGVSCKRRLTES